MQPVNGRKINEASLASFSFNRRKSLKGLPELSEDIPQNDDEAERQQRKRDSGKFGSLAGKRISFGGISELSAPELVAQYANCMRLSAENKINHKNAFNLPLIDCMKLLLKNKDEQMNNFQVVGCTLDASAKIYASRVDRVHMDGMSFAKGLGTRSKDTPITQKEGSDDEQNDEDNADRVKKEKKVKKARKLSRDVTKINICTDATVKDPTFVVLGKQFSNCQPSFISFIPRLKMVGDANKIIMNMNAPFLNNAMESSYKEGEIPFECEADGTEEMVPAPFAEILSRDCGEIDYDSLLSASVLEDSFGVMDSVLDDNVDNFGDEPIDFAFGNGAVEAFSDAVKDFAASTGDSQMDLESTRAGCTARFGPREKVVDVQQAILKQVKEGSNFEYSYMNLDQILWAGPTHWKPLPLSKAKDKKSALTNGPRKRERKVVNLDFSLKEVKMSIGRLSTLTNQYIENNWKSVNVTNPPELHLDPKILVRYFFRIHCCINTGAFQCDGNPAVPPDDDMNDYDYGNLNDSQHCPAADLEPSDGDCSADKELPAFEEESEPPIDVHSCDPASGDAWSMVDPPNKVARIQVPYAQHAKKVDMKVLKTAIWSVLCEDSNFNSIGDSEVTPKKRMKNANYCNGPSHLSSMTKEMKFSDMEKKVLKIVPTEMSQELSMPLVFTALLHLANERVLTLKELDDHSDIIIVQDCEAESFVKQLQEREFI